MINKNVKHFLKLFLITCEAPSNISTDESFAYHLRKKVENLKKKSSLNFPIIIYLKIRNTAILNPFQTLFFYRF